MRRRPSKHIRRVRTKNGRRRVLVNRCIPKKSKKLLKFYDLKSKKSFSTNDYGLVKKKNRGFAVANAPSGIKSWRIVSKSDLDFKNVLGDKR